MRRRKVSREVERELLEIYIKQGSETAAAACLKSGVSAKYASSIAASLGLGRPRWRAGTQYKTKPPTVTRTEDDPRWAWAIERGAVTI